MKNSGRISHLSQNKDKRNHNGASHTHTTQPQNNSESIDQSALTNDLMAVNDSMAIHVIRKGNRSRIESLCNARITPHI